MSYPNSVFWVKSLLQHQTQNNHLTFLLFMKLDQFGSKSNQVAFLVYFGPTNCALRKNFRTSKLVWGQRTVDESDLYRLLHHCWMHLGGVLIKSRVFYGRTPPPPSYVRFELRYLFFICGVGPNLADAIPNYDRVTSLWK